LFYAVLEIAYVYFSLFYEFMKTSNCHVQLFLYTVFAATACNASHILAII